METALQEAEEAAKANAAAEANQLVSADVAKALALGEEARKNGALWSRFSSTLVPLEQVF